jgi:hypothetical protein
MPPKKAKKSEPVRETPVIFFLRVSGEEHNTIVPVGDVPTYSDILSSVEVSATKDRFDNDLLKPILEKISRKLGYPLSFRFSILQPSLTHLSIINYN